MAFIISNKFNKILLSIALIVLFGNCKKSEQKDEPKNELPKKAFVSTFVGNSNDTSVDGVGSSAGFYHVGALSFDATGNLYAIDGQYRIRKITPDGMVSTFYNKLDLSYFFNDLFLDGAGSIYVSTFDGLIGKITQSGTVSLVAGGPRTNGDGIGGAAGFNLPYCMATDGAGNIYVTERAGKLIRKITPERLVTTIAGNGKIASIDGVAKAASFSEPFGICIDSKGNLFVTDINSVRKITPTGVVTTFAGDVQPGSVDGTGDTARFKSLGGIVIDGSDNLYVADSGNYLIRRITPNGVVTTVAGTAGISGHADGAGNVAKFNFASRLAIDAKGNLYVNDATYIRKIEFK